MSAGRLLLFGTCLFASLLARAVDLSPEDLARKKEGWYFLGLPFANYNTDFGVGVGAGAYLFQGGTRTNAAGRTNETFLHRPYEARIGLQVYVTTLGQHKHFLNLDVPRLGNDALSFSSEIAYLRTLAENYFGRGNDSVSDTNAAVNWNKVTIDAPQIEAKLGLDGPLGWSVTGGLRLKRAWVTSRRGAKTDDGKVVGPTLFDAERPVGSDGGWVNTATLDVAWDRRDFPAYPTRGFRLLLRAEGSSPALSDFGFTRLSFETDLFANPAPPLVLAARLRWTQMTGTPPFFEWASIGGNGSVRGLVDKRAIDLASSLFNAEARLRFLRWKWGKEAFDLAFVPFFDAGRVEPLLFGAGYFTGFRWSAGAELILTWNLTTHLNVTFGASPEGTAFAIDTRLLF